MPRLIASVALAAVLAAGGCRSAEPPSRYPLRGQVLAVDAEQQQVTVRHDDIPGLMPGMTMSFPVASAELMEGREPGELIVATLEVTNSVGRLTTIARTGFEALPEGDSLLALATGVLDVGDEVPDTAFIDQDDRRRSLSEWAGHYTLVTFIYTQCPLPNFCPLMDQNFSTLQREIAEDDLLRGRVRLISFSFDPDHDTPEVLAAHAERRRADPAVWTFMTADRATIVPFAARFGVGVVDDPADPTLITHNLRTALIGPDLRILELYSGNGWTPRDVLADLRDALSGS
jgi:protein SCO1/2